VSSRDVGYKARRGILPAIVVIALGLALYRIDARGLWGDEVWTVWWSGQQSVLSAFDRFRAPPDLPLHFAIVRAAMAFGESELAARLPSALFAVSSVLFAYLFAARAFGRDVAAIAALLLAIAPLNVWYAQDARPYALLSFLGIASLYFAFQLFRARRRRPIVSLVIVLAFVNAGAIYDHLFGIFPIFVESLIVIAWWATRRPPSHTTIRAFLVSFALTPLVCAPVVNGIVQYVIHGDSYPWPDQPPIVDQALTALGQYGAGPGWLLVLFAIPVVSGAIVGLRRAPLATALLIGTIVVPFLVLGIGAPRHPVSARYALFMQPAWLILCAAGIATAARAGMKRASRRPWAHGALGFATLIVVGVFVVAELRSTVDAYGISRGTDWSGVCRIIRDEATPDEVIMGDAYHDGIMGWCLGGLDPRPAILPAGRQSVPDVLATGRGVWYIHVGPPDASIDPALLSIPEIPPSAWTTGLTTGTSGFPWIVSEWGARLFHAPPGLASARIEFHESSGVAISPNWPDYVQLGTGHQVYVARLRLASVAHRQLLVTYLMTSKPTIKVDVDGTSLGMAEVPGGTGWVTAVMPLPDDLPDGVTVTLRASIPGVTAISAIELHDAN
jgi:Dolichyl-phosphate-mannose-protein mannosyltransferase